MKSFYSLFVSILLCSASIFAQSEPINKTSDIETQANDTIVETSIVQGMQSRPFSDRWTIGLKGGVTYFQLPLAQQSPEYNAQNEYFGFMSDLSHEFSIYSEYEFDYGLGLGAYVGNYSYSRYAVIGSSIEFGLYAHINLMEGFSWRQQPPIAQRFHIFLDAGLGVATLWQLNQIAGDYSSDTVFWNAAAVIRLALQFEFMLKPNWGLWIEPEYHGYGRGGRMINDTESKNFDFFTHSAPWINAFMVNAGVRYYFGNRKHAPNPLLDENDLPVKKKRKNSPNLRPAPKNAVYVNVNITPEMIEAARKNGGSIAIQSTGLDGMPQSSEIESALKVLEEQGIGTVLINSIQFVNEQLTDESMLTLDKVAGSLLANNLWTKVDLLYMSDSQSAVRASVIATYLRAKGVRNISVKGYDSKSREATSDLVITIK